MIKFEEVISFEGANSGHHNREQRIQKILERNFDQIFFGTRGGYTIVPLCVTYILSPCGRTSLLFATSRAVARRQSISIDIAPEPSLAPNILFPFVYNSQVIHEEVN